MPAYSITARAEAPAFIPVPEHAGLKYTLAALYLPHTSCGIVSPFKGILTICFLASLTALLTALGTSRALPNPIPTLPFLSPTTTSALKLIDLPPFVTVVQRLILTTVSSIFIGSSKRAKRFSFFRNSNCIFLQLQLRLLSFRGTYNHLYQTQLLQYPYFLPLLQSFSQQFQQQPHSLRTSSVSEDLEIAL